MGIYLSKRKKTIVKGKSQLQNIRFQPAAQPFRNKRRQVIQWQTHYNAGIFLWWITVPIFSLPPHSWIIYPYPLSCDSAISPSRTSGVQLFPLVLVTGNTCSLLWSLVSTIYHEKNMPRMRDEAQIWTQSIAQSRTTPVTYPRSIC